MIPTKTCSKCGETKSLIEFNRDKTKKDGRRPDCKECRKVQKRKYYQNHRERMNKQSREYHKEHKNEIRQQKGYISMNQNKNCSLYLGIVIGECLIRHLFKDVEVMPHGNPKFDFICNKGKKIDVKSGCTTLSNGYPRWVFQIDYNTIADYFILVAFDNLTDLNPLHLWMIPGKEINNQTKASISPSTIHKWSQWERDINDAQLCCTEIKNEEREKRQ